ncbi:MAG: glycoside hydrolase family 3 protein, partial [Actinobacteria bacterium]
MNVGDRGDLRHQRGRAGAAIALAAAVAALAGAVGSAPAAPVPYRLPAPLPRRASSPSIDRRAPYTPLVRSLIHQLEPTSPPTLPELTNAARIFQGGLGPAGANPTCHAVGAVAAPVGTNPSIAPLCWADAVGVNILNSPNRNRTTATPEPLAIGSSFDPKLANVWGQVEGAEGRRLMVTGLFGPEADVSVQPNWERGLDTLGEDPFLNDVMSAAQVDGMQAHGLMAQLKHFAAFSGANRYTLTEVADQALHEILLTPFESGFRRALAASTMCAYDEYRDTSRHLPGPPTAYGAGRSPYVHAPLRTWPLGEPHWACEHPLALAYTLRSLWHSIAFVGSDFPATHSTSAMVQGESQEFFTPTFF